MQISATLSLQQKTTPILSKKDEAKLNLTALHTPVCAGHGRYHWGPKELLIAGPGMAWKFSYVYNKLTKISMEPTFSESGMTAAGLDYIIHWLTDKKTYRLFDLKKMTWVGKSGKVMIGKSSGIVPVHVSMKVNICPV